MINLQFLSLKGSLTRDFRTQELIAGVNETGEKFIAGVNDTGDKFLIVDTGQK
jgi:hypothetical protein